MMKKLGALLFFLLAIACGVGLVLAWDVLGKYSLSLYSIDLPWLTGRVVVALMAIIFAFRSLQLFRETEPPQQFEH
jgi:uncharacterized protein HemY